MTSNTALKDVRVAHVLADVPAFATWHNRPLSRQLRQLVSDLDEQTLMSLTAFCLHQLIESQGRAHRDDRRGLY